MKSCLSQSSIIANSCLSHFFSTFFSFYWYVNKYTNRIGSSSAPHGSLPISVGVMSSPNSSISKKEKERE